MKPAPFEYFAPDTVDGAVADLARLGDEAKVIAGGQSLVPMLALRLAVFDHLVDVGRIDALKGIERRDDALWLGAATTQATIERSAEVAAAVPLLAKATPFIGHLQIRSRGTVGGSIAHADPAAEYPAVALALDATMEVTSVRGSRTIAAGDFFDGLWSTTMDPDELLVGVSFPIWDGRCGFAVEELARRHGDFAIAGAVVGVALDADDRIARCAVGLIGLGSMPERAAHAESELVGRPIAEVAAADVGQLAMVGLESIPADLHGSVAYRRRVGVEMTARAWTTATEDARRARVERGETWPERPAERSEARAGAMGLTSSRRRSISSSAGHELTVDMVVNGEAVAAAVEPRLTLADFLREGCRLTGTHLGCEHGVCGACTVLIDGAPVRSCLVFAVQAEGAEVTTIEGIAAADGELSPVQAAFRDCHGLQCGFCTPGFVVTATAFLRETPEPSDDEIREALSGNLCRCTGYQGIMKAVHQAAVTIRTEGAR